MTNESDKPSKPKEQPKPERPVPPRQDDPLLGDYIKKGYDPKKKGETRQK